MLMTPSKPHAINAVPMKFDRGSPLVRKETPYLRSFSFRLLFARSKKSFHLIYYERRAGKKTEKATHLVIE